MSPGCTPGRAVGIVLTWAVIALMALLLIWQVLATLGADLITRRQAVFRVLNSASPCSRKYSPANIFGSTE